MSQQTGNTVPGKRNFAICAVLLAPAVLFMGGVGFRRAQENRPEVGSLGQAAGNVGKLETVALQIQIYWTRFSAEPDPKEREVSTGVLRGLQDKRTLYMDWLDANAPRDSTPWMDSLRS